MDKEVDNDENIINEQKITNKNELANDNLNSETKKILKNILNLGKKNVKVV